MHINHDTKVSKKSICKNKYQCIQGSTTGIDEPKREENEEQEREIQELKDRTKQNVWIDQDKNQFDAAFA
jgi:hypothetical protein